MIIFTDFSNAYSLVNPVKLQRILKWLNIPPSICHAVKILSREHHCHFLLNGRVDTKPERCLVGLRQGDPVAPLLFNIYTMAFSKMSDHLAMFADDHALVDFTLEQFLRYCSITKALDMKLNVEKCRYLHIETIDWLDKLGIPHTQYFKYLGINIYNSGRIIIPEEKLITMEKAIGYIRLFNLGLQSRALYFNQYIVSKILHYLPHIQMDKGLIQRIESMQRKLMSITKNRYFGRALTFYWKEINMGGFNLANIQVLHQAVRSFWWRTQCVPGTTHFPYKKMITLPITTPKINSICQWISMGREKVLTKDVYKALMSDIPDEPDTKENMDRIKKWRKIMESVMKNKERDILWRYCFRVSKTLEDIGRKWKVPPRGVCTKCGKIVIPGLTHILFECSVQPEILTPPEKGEGGDYILFWLGRNITSAKISYFLASVENYKTFKSLGMKRVGKHLIRQGPKRPRGNAITHTTAPPSIQKQTIVKTSQEVRKRKREEPPPDPPPEKRRCLRELDAPPNATARLFRPSEGMVREWLRKGRGR